MLSSARGARPAPSTGSGQALRHDRVPRLTQTRRLVPQRPHAEWSRLGAPAGEARWRRRLSARRACRRTHGLGREIPWMTCVCACSGPVPGRDAPTTRPLRVGHTDVCQTVAGAGVPLRPDDDRFTGAVVPERYRCPTSRFPSTGLLSEATRSGWPRPTARLDRAS